MKGNKSRCAFASLAGRRCWRYKVGYIVQRAGVWDLSWPFWSCMSSGSHLTWLQPNFTSFCWKRFVKILPTLSHRLELRRQEGAGERSAFLKKPMLGAASQGIHSNSPPSEIWLGVTTDLSPMEKHNWSLRSKGGEWVLQCLLLWNQRIFSSESFWAKFKLHQSTGLHKHFNEYSSGNEITLGNAFVGCFM